MATGEQSAGRIGVRASLPRGRAVVGGLLIATAAMGVFLAHDAATRTDQRRWVVARSDIAMGQRSSGEVVQSWMNSSGHRANILNRGHRRIGVAAYTTSGGTTYWCQQFAP